MAESLWDDEFQKAIESGKMWGDIMEEEERKREAEADRLAISRGEEAPSAKKKREIAEKLAKDKAEKEAQDREEYEKHEAFEYELSMRVDMAEDDRRENKEILIPVGIDGFHNLANDEFFYQVLEEGDKLILQRLKHGVPTIEIVTFSGKLGGYGFRYLTSSGREFEFSWDDMVYGDELITDHLDNIKAFKILRIFPEGSGVDLEEIKSSMQGDTSAPLVPPFDVPSTVTPAFFKKNLQVGQVLIAKRYIPSGPSRNLIKVQNNLVVEKKFDDVIRVKYLFEGQVKWVNNISYENLFGNEDLLPKSDQALFISKVILPGEEPVVVRPVTVAPAEAPLSKYKSSIKVGSVITANRLRPKAGSFTVAKNNILVVKSVNDYGARVEYSYGGRVLWDAFINFDDMFDNEAELLRSNKDKALHIIKIESPKGGDNDMYYTKYLKYKAKYLKLKNSN